MGSVSVREFIRDTVMEVSDKLSFAYARDSDFDAIRNKKFPAVLLRPLNGEIEIRDDTLFTKYNVGLLFYDLDKKGDDENNTRKILESLDDVLASFLIKLNRRSLTVLDDVEDDITSEKIVISGVTVKERIKFTSDIVTGWEVTFSLELPTIIDYCKVYD